jgi:transposase-like protein
MKKRARRNHSPAFKAKVALAAIKAIAPLLSYLSSVTFT